MKRSSQNIALIVALSVGLVLPVAGQEPPEPRPNSPALEPAPLTHGLAGPYLAARMAISQNDYRAAAEYFLRAVAEDPTDKFLNDGALISLISAGDMDGAVKLSGQIADRGAKTELARLVEQADLAKQGNWPELLSDLDGNGAGHNGLLGDMMRAWALLGAGKASESLAEFEELSKDSDTGELVKYHFSLARALVGDYEGALSLLDGSSADGNILGLTAHIQILAQLERRDEAIAILNDINGLDAEPQLLKLRDQLVAGQSVGFDVIKSPADGLAQLMLAFASAFSGSPEPEPLALIHARLAAWISPDTPEIRLLVAQLLQQQQQFDLAEDEFEVLRRTGQMRPSAELARIDALAHADRQDEAERAALALTAAYPTLPEAWIALGDLLRQQEKFAQAIPAYDKALMLLADAPKENRWFPLYARGIAHERTGNFAAAEADLLAAIEIRPDQASLLNYLGYSWIDRNENLERALELIRKAVALSPDDGYILDSLAWAYYRLGRYAEAVEPMEQAIGQMASDPLVNDHLGDIYWMVGREREAEIQWKRALSLEETESGEVDKDRIRDKLVRGLDVVLADEAGTDKAQPEGEKADLSAN